MGLQRQYKKYLADYNEYGPDAFGHAAELPDWNAPKEDLERIEFIMETQYNIFFVLLMWYELDSPDIIVDLQEKSVARSEVIIGGFKDTFVYRLGNVFINLAIIIVDGIKYLCT